MNVHEKKKLICLQGAYVVIHLFNAIAHGTVLISPIATPVPLIDSLITALQKVTINVAFVTPSIIQALARDPEKLKFVARRLEMFIYCGGEIPKVLGDIVSSQIRLASQYGASEMGFAASIQRETERDWRYIHFHPDIGAEMRHHSKNMYELVIVCQNPKYEAHQPVFKFFPSLQEYRSRDLWIPHPVYKDLWRHCARSDDLITLSSGEQINPNFMEQHILTYCREVAAVLMIGSERPAPALLIEMNNAKNFTTQEKAILLEGLWPKIDEASRENYPELATKLERSHVLFTYPTKPILRAPKGTLQRQLTTRLYAQELEELYANASSVLMQSIGQSKKLSEQEKYEIVSKGLKESVVAVYV